METVVSVRLFIQVISALWLCWLMCYFPRRSFFFIQWKFHSVTQNFISYIIHVYHTLDFWTFDSLGGIYAKKFASSLRHLICAPLSLAVSQIGYHFQIAGSGQWNRFAFETHASTREKKVLPSQSNPKQRCHKQSAQSGEWWRWNPASINPEIRNLSSQNQRNC